jgi:homoserine kinase
MRKVTVRLPATLAGIGPGIRGLGLAVGLYTTVEISERADQQLIVDAAGEGSGRYSIGLRHPVVLALMRVFQQFERAPLGVQVRIQNAVPVDCGLGAEAAFWAAGVIGAGNLLGQSLSRADILRISAQISGQPGQTASALLGGLASGVLSADQFICRALPVAPLRLIIVVPELRDYPTVFDLPDNLHREEALHNLSRLPLLLEALRTGDLPLLAQMLDDHLYHPRLRGRIPGYADVSAAARLAGAVGVTISGTGPALAAFAPQNHQQVAQAMTAAFADAGVKARSWVVPVDTQGVVISAAQSA